MSLSFVQLNIESNYHLDRVAAILESQPDVVCLQEVFKVNLKEFAKKYGYNYCFSPCTILNSSEGKFAPLGEWGVAILTKLPQFNTSECYYAKNRDDVKPEINPPSDFPRTLLSTSISYQGKNYNFATTHFTWAMPEVADQVQAKDLKVFMNCVEDKESLVLSGDFNAPRGGIVQTTIAKKYNYHIPPSVNTTIDNELHRAAPLYFVIDHLFASRDYKVSDVIVATSYSDHCAIFANIEKITI